MNYGEGSSNLSPAEVALLDGRNNRGGGFGSDGDNAW